ncbi:MAG: energy transducer TonB [Candidatus Acidiferrales bacterium]
MFDFLGPGDTLSQLGEDLADTFSRSLAKVAPDVNVIDRMQVRAVIEKNRVAPTVVRDSEISWWLAHELKAQSLIVGQLSPADGGKVHLVISVATVQSGKDFENFSVDIPITPEMKDHFAKTVWSATRSRVPPPGTTISKYPVCRRCPSPQFSEAAMTNHQEGVVVLVAQVGVDGTLRNIDFVNGVQYGLTQRAIVAVQSWKLDPAKDTKGRPIELAHRIEVHFQMKH